MYRKRGRPRRPMVGMYSAARAAIARNNGAHIGVLSSKRQNRFKRAFSYKVQTALNNIAEKKYKANSIPQTAVDFTGSLVDFHATIAQGDTDITRDGDQLWTRSFEFNYISIGVDTTNAMRILIFIWKPTSTPVVTDILAFGNGTNVAPGSPYNHDRRSDFYILYDALHSYSLGGPDCISKKILIYKIPTYLRKAQYVNQGTVGANHIYVLFISDSAAATHPTIAYNSKLNFTDA